MSLWLLLFLGSFVLLLCSCYYIFWLIRYISDSDENLENLSFNLKQFEEHLAAIYEMEMFYGDDTLKSLLSHSREIQESLKEFRILTDEAPPDLEDEDEGGPALE